MNRPPLRTRDIREVSAPFNGSTIQQLIQGFSARLMARATASPSSPIPTYPTVEYDEAQWTVLDTIFCGTFIVLRSAGPQYLVVDYLGLANDATTRLPKSLYIELSWDAPPPDEQQQEAIHAEMARVHNLVTAWQERCSA